MHHSWASAAGRPDLHAPPKRVTIDTGRVGRWNMRGCPDCHISEQQGPFLIGLLNGEAAAMQDNKDENNTMQDNNGRRAGTPANGAADHGDAPAIEKSTWVTRRGLAQMLKGGVIMDVVTPEHARIAED